MPGDLGLNPVAVTARNPGLQRVVCQKEFKPQDLELSLVTIASSDNFQSLHFSVVGDGEDFQFLIGVVVNSHLILVQVSADLVEEVGHVQRYPVGVLVGGQQGIHDNLGTYLDTALYVELVLLFLVDEDLQI